MNTDLQKIWVAVIPDKSLEIDIEHFRIILRLVALVQQGYEPEASSLTKYGIFLLQLVSSIEFHVICKIGWNS